MTDVEFQNPVYRRYRLDVVVIEPMSHIDLQIQFEPQSNRLGNSTKGLI